MTYTSLCTPKNRNFGAETSTLRTPIRPSPPSAVCQNGELGSVGLTPRVSPKPCGASARFDARCVRLASASHRRFTSTQTRRRISLRSGNLRLSSNGGAVRFTTHMDPLQIGGRAKYKCERFLLESTHLHQTSDTSVASPTRTRASSSNEEGASPFGDAKDQSPYDFVKSRMVRGPRCLLSLGHQLSIAPQASLPKLVHEREIGERS